MTATFDESVRLAIQEAFSLGKKLSQEDANSTLRMLSMLLALQHDIAVIKAKHEAKVTDEH